MFCCCCCCFLVSVCFILLQGETLLDLFLLLEQWKVFFKIESVNSQAENTTSLPDARAVYYEIKFIYHTVPCDVGDGVSVYMYGIDAVMSTVTVFLVTCIMLNLKPQNVWVFFNHDALFSVLQWWRYSPQ